MPFGSHSARGLAGGVGVLVMALLVLGAGCDSERTAAPELGVSAAAFTQIVEGTDDFLRPGAERKVEAWIGYVDGDRVVRIENGDSFEIDDITITMHVTPFPPSQFDATAELRLADPSGQPIEVAVEAWYDMVFMTHGPLTVDVEQLGTGQVRMPLDLFMFGPWVVKTTIESSRGATEIPLVFYVWPNTP